jgi:hypothetical protein
VALNDVGKAMKQSYVRQGPAIMFNQSGTDWSPINRGKVVPFIQGCF